jgi:Ca-activated chloride channel homolog
MRKSWLLVSAGGVIGASALALMVPAWFLDPGPLPPLHLRQDTHAPRRPASPPATRAPALKPDSLQASDRPARPPAKVALDLGIEGGVPGGVEGGVAGGVPGGIVGGVVGGMPEAPMADGVIRVGGTLALPHRGLFTEAYSHIRDNGFRATSQDPLSTFSIDVDTASYANVRRFLGDGRLPPKDAVRIEELINYFRYDYPQPEGDHAFSVTAEVFDCPWKPEHRLVSIGLQGRTLEGDDVPARNLVFLIDVSGSMQGARKLPMVKAALGLLANDLRPQDRVSIVVYAGSEGLVLPSTSGAQRLRIRSAIERLEAGGTTAGGAGLTLAYAVAAQTFVPGGINRVILATDGDFNVGITSQGDLVRLIEEKRKTGVFLSVLGFGMGNLKDSTMEALAQHGNGNYAYIDSLFEARKVLVEEAGATLVTIAKDVKIQVEWNPRRVAAYRLIGYENRLLAAEDFNDDAKDAGEIGAGHTVTALYEIAPVGSGIPLRQVDPLKYQQPRPAGGGDDGEIATVKVRHKGPDEPAEGGTSRLTSVAVADAREAVPSENARFAAAVAGFGMLLRDSEHKGDLTWARVIDMAAQSQGTDREGYRAQFLDLARTARSLGSRRITDSQ